MLQGTGERLQRGLQWIWAQEGSPACRARGLAAGVFCGCFPFFGLQMILSVGVAAMIRGNPLLAAAGTLVSNPLTTARRHLGAFSTALRHLQSRICQSGCLALCI